MTIDERIERMAGAVETLAATVMARDDKIEAHDRQIEKLIELHGELAEGMKDLKEQAVSTERQWQAYINTLPRQ